MKDNYQSKVSPKPFQEKAFIRVIVLTTLMVQNLLGLPHRLSSFRSLATFVKESGLFGWLWCISMSVSILLKLNVLVYHL